MSMPTETRNVLFDLDGTLIDSLPGIEFSVDCALAECGMPARQRELRSLIGPPIRTIFSQLLGAPDDEHLSKLEHAFRISYDSAGWLKTVPAASALDTLRAFHNAGLRLFIVTNKPSTPTRRIIEHLGIETFFSNVLCRNSKTPPFASKAEMLRHLVREHHLQLRDCLYVGDTSEDYLAAKDVGLPVALVTYGYGDPDAVHPECIHLDQLSELLAIAETMEMS